MLHGVFHLNNSDHASTQISHGALPWALLTLVLLFSFARGGKGPMLQTCTDINHDLAAPSSCLFSLNHVCHIPVLERTAWSRCAPRSGRMASALKPASRTCRAPNPHKGSRAPKVACSGERPQPTATRAAHPQPTLKIACRALRGGHDKTRRLAMYPRAAALSAPSPRDGKTAARTPGTQHLCP